MSLPRKYGAPAELDQAKLQEWLNNIEGVAQAKVIEIKTNKVARMSVAIVDLEIAKPSKKIKLQMGRLPGGSDPITGEAYIVSQIMEVTISRG